METWDETLVELKRQYLSGCTGRLRRMDACLHRLDGPETPDAAGEALAEVHRELHSLAGSGSIYGLPAISRLGALGERRCREIFEQATDRAGATPLERAELQQTIDALRAEIEAASGAARTLYRRRRDVGLAAPSAHVLVVAADSSARQRLVRELEAQALPWRTADTRAAALADVAGDPPAGMIVAAELPDGSGYELTERVRALPGAPARARLPVLVEGPAAGSVDRVEAICCGADGWLEGWAGAGEPAPRLRELLRRGRGAARVLSVEDDPAQVAALRHILESAGYEFRSSADPTAFEEELAAFQPDLVLMDVLLPETTGYELARRLRQDAARAALPILFLTTEGQLAARLESARVGDDHLTKPVVPELLLAAVAARLERSQTLRGMLDGDGLTRLLNQTALLERARRAVARKAREPRRRTAWMMLDLDRFKAINDRYGHPAGDRVLAAFGALLGRRLRPTDAAGRYGGEEFAILVDDLDARDAVRLADRLREEFHSIEHAAPAQAAFRATFSAGVAFLRPGMDLDEWREEADRALYRAKASGRNQIQLAVPPLPPLPGVDSALVGELAVA